MAKIKIGSNTIDNVKIGNNDVKIYLGDTQIFPESLPPQPTHSGGLRFTALESTNIAFSIFGTLTTIPTLNYSINGGTETAYTLGTQIALSVGDYCEFYGDNDSFSTGTSNYISFSSTGNVNASGNIMSLVDSSCESLEIPNDYCFAKLFYQCTKLINAKDLLLPATTLKIRAYYYFFRECSNLITAPRELPANLIKSGAYSYMFYSTSIEKSPNILATSGESNCCSYMFRGCSQLNELCKLSIIDIPITCCLYMYTDCSKIKISTTPSAEYRYEYRLPYGAATGTIGSSALYGMFSNTGGTFKGTPTVNTRYYTSNKIVGVDYKEMPLTLYCASAGDIDWANDEGNWNIDLWYRKNGGTLTQLTEAGQSISTAVGDKLEFFGDNEQFSTSETDCYYFLMNGEFVCNGNIMSLLSKNNFTQLTTVPEYAFTYLFYQSPILTSPLLPATTVGDYGYEFMFAGSTIVCSPVISATTLEEYGCYAMFESCQSLTTIPNISQIESLGTLSCYNMYNFCSSIEVSETQSDYYNHEYKIPNGNAASFQHMFSSTGGSFRGTPTPNTTYYTHNEVV